MDGIQSMNKTYNLLDIGGSVGYLDENGYFVNPPFSVGECPLYVENDMYSEEGSRGYGYPGIFLENGAVFENAKQNDKITIVFMFPALTTNMAEQQVCLHLDGVSNGTITDLCDLYVRYNVNENNYSFYKGRFGPDLIVDPSVTPITEDNSDRIIGISLSGVLERDLYRISISPDLNNDTPIHQIRSAMTFASYDDLRITLNIADEPDTVLAWKKHDAYARKGEPAAYRYNDIELPALPEWDKTAYPYAYIFESSVNGFELFALSGEIHANSESTCLFHSQSVTGLVWEIQDGAWVTRDLPYLRIAPVIWSNTDLYYSQFVDGHAGTLYLAGSDPVPVYGNTEWLKAHYYKVIDGKWVKQDGVAPSE